jgi:hypothetical protein
VNARLDSQVKELADERQIAAAAGRKSSHPTISCSNQYPSGRIFSRPTNAATCCFMCRKHQMTIPDIKAFISENNLTFGGFVLPPASLKKRRVIPIGLTSPTLIAGTPSKPSRRMRFPPSTCSRCKKPAAHAHSAPVESGRRTRADN